MDRPKRLLSLDGGGIRGIIAAEVLNKIEKILLTHNSHWQCLGDYFDFIGGTSTGSFLAAGLASGMKVKDLLNFYIEKGDQIFKQRWMCKIPIIGRLWTKFKSEPLEGNLQKFFLDSSSNSLLFGSSELKTRLMIVSKNATSGETWFFVNDKKNKFFEKNADLPVWQIIRASSAAPTYFPPCTLQTENGPNEFIDGGLSPYNNPAFQLFLEATWPEYGISWTPGKNNMLLISVGTGFSVEIIPFPKARRFKALSWAPYAIDTFMDSANLQQNHLLQLMSQERADRNSSSSTHPVTDYFQSLLTYHRYTISFDQERFKDLNLEDIDVEKVKPLDCIDQIQTLQRIGKKIAEPITIEAFEGFLADDQDA